MTDKTRIRIAATITALFLAGLSVAGLAAQGDAPQAAPAAAAEPAPAVQTPTVSAYESEDDERGDHRYADDDDGYEQEREDGE